MTKTPGVREARNEGVRLAYEIRGAGDPLLLVQGLGYGRWGWKPVAGTLARTFQVILFDNRGVGDSDVPRGPYSVRQLAEDAVGVLDAAGVERAHVIGASLGGMVAQELAISHPERVDRIVLVCTTTSTSRGGGRNSALSDNSPRKALRGLPASCG